MRGEPPERLVKLLDELQLADAESVRAMRPRVRKLAGELPDFESVWVDALAQARVLTPYQAAEINADRGDALACGPYVVLQPLATCHYASAFVAHHTQSGRVVWLYVARSTAGHAVVELVERLESLRDTRALVAEDAGGDGEQIWAACAASDGVTAASWMTENGRFPPQVVLHIAREMVARLATLEKIGRAHGDIGAAGLLLERSGQVVLPMPGLRNVVRASEGYGFVDLQPEAYDYLAPERIAYGGPADLASDIYACGCLWWHLLTGRAPFGGGNSLARLKNAHAARFVDVRQLAIDVPESLSHAIERCVARDRASRPQSTVELATLLGTPLRSDGALLGRLLRDRNHDRGVRRGKTRGSSKGSKRVLVAAGAMVVGAMLALGWVSNRGAARRVADATGHGKEARVEVDSVAKPIPAIATRKREESVADSTQVDRDVQLATAVEAAGNTLSDDLVLDGSGVVDARDIKLKPGQRVRGPIGTRPRVVLGGSALVVDCDDVSFENIDFVWEASKGKRTRGDAGRAMFVARARAIEWRGCSFSGASSSPPAAILWEGPAESIAGDAGELKLCDCVVRDASAVVESEQASGLSVELTNTLCVASGPIVRLFDSQRREEPVTIALDRVTTRGDSSLIEWRYGRIAREPGPLAISVAASALATNPGGALLALVGADKPDRLLQRITWNGDGSLVTPDTAIATWERASGQRQILPDDALDVGGLVQTAVEFAGEADGPPAASVLTRWQVPLRSADPPGIQSAPLSSPGNPADGEAQFDSRPK